jgi:hypothetical protein
MLAKLISSSFWLLHILKLEKDRLAELGLEKVNVQDQIDRFNQVMKSKSLIGTSAIHVGCNICFQ